ncbi:glutamate receptor ionotropic, kainate 4-like [Babylonia areolata]|uniref:glutamate receptor ionotropic, kainate 4-like n=1 Tax=Babylonia areolata TaxID=304850 RepID=UPI003FD34DAD
MSDQSLTTADASTRGCISNCEHSTMSSLTGNSGKFSDSLDLAGRTLRMVTSVWEPFVIRHQNESATWYTGLCIDILDILVSGLNFTCTITEPPDGLMGIQLPNGTWAGMTGMLHRKEADFVLAGLSVTADRATVTDHTTGFFYDEVTLMATRPDPVRAVWSFLLLPFHWLVYAALAGGLVVTTALFLWLDGWDRKLPHGGVVAEGRKMGSSNYCFDVADTVMALFGGLMGRGTVAPGKSGSGRVVLCSWLLLSLVLAGTYTGKLTASALLVRQPLPFSSLAQLLTRSDYTWGLSRGTMMEAFFSNSSIPEYQQYYQKMLQFADEDPDVMSPDFENVIVHKVLTESYVFVAPHSFYSILKHQHCQLTVVPERLFQDMLAIHLQKGSPYTAVFDVILTRAKEQGLLEHLKRKWLGGPSLCQGGGGGGGGGGARKDPLVRSVSLDLLLTAFLLAASGLGLATLLLLGECLLARSRPLLAL